MVSFPFKSIYKYFFVLLVIINLILLDFGILGLLKNQKEYFNNKEVLVKDITPLVPTSVPTLSIPAPTLVRRPVSTHEIYIPLGTGSTSKSVWTPLNGVEVALDTNKQGTIKEVYFQATLRIPTGNGRISAKLYNETDKHDVWFSEVSGEGDKGVIKEAKISLTQGLKTYRVYLKSSLEYEAFLDFARLKLIVEE